MTRKLLIIGASARAAAQSAIRADYQPFAIDQFADADLQACCTAACVENYPAGIARLAHQFPLCPFLYTGALENHPSVIDQISRVRPLWGNTAEVVRRVRDPWTLQESLMHCGLKTPELCENKPTGPGWLRKPLRSGGGIGIREDKNGPDGDVEVEPAQGQSHYYQRFTMGEPASALFVGAGGQSLLLGITRQLIGCDWAGAEQFLYVGNIGTITLPPVVADQFQRIGDALAQTFGLTGLFGVDAIVQQREVWTLEVNPRYTAAVEILERSSDRPLIQLHAEACDSGTLPQTKPQLPVRLHGKAIIYSQRSLVIGSEFVAWVTCRNRDERFPQVADIPGIDTMIPRGKPVCTVFASAQTEADVRTSLQKMAAEAYRVLE